MRYITAFLLLVSIGCAPLNNGLASVEDRVHDAYVEIDNKTRASCPDPKDIKAPLAQVCQEVRKEKEALRVVVQTFTEGVLDQKLSSVGPLIEAAGKLQTASIKGFDAVMQTDLMRLIKQIIDAAMSIASKGAVK